MGVVSEARNWKCDASVVVRLRIHSSTCDPGCGYGPVGNQGLVIVLRAVAVQIIELADFYMRHALDLEGVCLALVIAEAVISAASVEVKFTYGRQPYFVFAAGIGSVIERNQLDRNGAAIIVVLRPVGVLAGGPGGACDDSSAHLQLPAGDIVG